MKSFLVFFIALFIAGCASMYKTPEIVTVAGRGDLLQLKSLIASGANVNDRDFNGKTALYAATEYHRVDAVKLLLESGASNFDAYYVDFYTRESYTPLMTATKYNNPEIIKILLEAGADVDARNNWGDTALMAAADSSFVFDNVEMAKLLINSGADVNATKPNMTTALMISARKGDGEMINILLGAGADVNIGFDTGDTALSLAIGNSKEAHKKEWMKKCYKLYHQGKECRTDPDLSIIKTLIDNGAKVNQFDQEGRTLLDRSIGDVGTKIPVLLIESGSDLNKGEPLMMAAYHGNSELARLLIEKYGLDVNKKIKTKNKYTNNSTALHFAAIKGHEKTVKVLLEEGAAINAQSKNGDTALILAAMNGRLNAVKELISSGADLSIKNNDRYTPLEIARKNGKLGSVKLLEEAGAKK